MPLATQRPSDPAAQRPRNWAESHRARPTLAKSSTSLVPSRSSVAWVLGQLSLLASSPSAIHHPSSSLASHPPNFHARSCLSPRAFLPFLIEQYNNPPSNNSQKERCFRVSRHTGRPPLAPEPLLNPPPPASCPRLRSRSPPHDHTTTTHSGRQLDKSTGRRLILLPLFLCHADLIDQNFLAPTQNLLRDPPPHPTQSSSRTHPHITTFARTQYTQTLLFSTQARLPVIFPFPPASAVSRIRHPVLCAGPSSSIRSKPPPNHDPNIASFGSSSDLRGVSN